MEVPPKQKMSPVGYFGTGVAVGLLIGIFTGFLAYGILSEDEGLHETPSGFDTSVQDLSERQRDADRLDAAPPNFWDEHSQVPQGNSEDEAREPDAQRPNDAGDRIENVREDAPTGGIRDLDNWPEPSDNGVEDDAVEEDQWPNPGGGRLADDPSIPFSPPEE